MDFFILQQQASGCPSRSTLIAQHFGLTNRPSLTSPGTMTSPSLTPTPSSSSLNSLGGFNCAPPTSGIDLIDQTGGDCSTTASPRYISNAGVGLLSPCPSPLVSARGTNNQFANSIFLGGSIPCGYMLNDEGDVLGLREDHNTLANSYFPGDMIESREMLPGQSPVETPTSSLSGAPIPNTGVGPLQSSFYCAQQLGVMANNNNNTRNGFSANMIYNTQQHHPFLQEARASNQNTPIGSPQAMGVSANIVYNQPHPFLQESRASNQNTPIGSPQPNVGTF